MGELLCDCCVTVGSWNFEQENQDLQKEESIFTELHYKSSIPSVSHLQKSCLN